ncbi:MAG: L-dopachrome tautomerase-related protein, partial [Pseudomonadota bacterium]
GFTAPEDVDMVIDGRVVTLGGAPARVGVNPIAIDAEGEWVYFAPMSGRSMYRVRSADLRNERLDDAALTARVERFGDKPLSDGSIVDAGGNVYVTSITDETIGVIRPNGVYETLFAREDLSWTDGFALGPGGAVYVTVNQLHRSPVLNDGTDARAGDFLLLKFDALN